MSERVLPAWENLPCQGCGNEHFVAVMVLKAKVGGGMTPSQGGWQCSQCGKLADVHAMQQAVARKQRLAELRALEAEMEPESALPRRSQGGPSSSS